MIIRYGITPIEVNHMARNVKHGRHGRWLAVAASGVLLLTAPQEARAGDDSGCHAWDIVDSPADGAVDVPLNPMLLYRELADHEPFGIYGPPETIDVQDASSNVYVAEGDRLAEPDCVTAYFLSAPLAPLTEYCIPEVSACFTTGSEADNVAPDFVLGTDDPAAGLLVTFTGSEDIVLLTVSVGSDLGTQGIGLAPQSPIDTATWAEDDGDTITITAWDRAGNQTSDTVTLDIPSSGCQAARAPAAPLLCPGLLILAFLLWRRRRS
ncbi:hypothetical protein ACFL51_02165 [Myxococcota bacterium]